MELRLTPAVALFCSFLLFVSTTLMMSSAHSVPLEEEWGDWVKERHTDIDCPWNTKAIRACVWPGNLSLSLEKNGLIFTQQVEVFSKQAKVLLPGNEKHWPTQITLNHPHHKQQPATVIEVSKLPYIQLEKGKHIIKGRFNWKAKPASLAIPSNAAFISLSEQGKVLQVNRHGNRLIFAQRKNDNTEQKRDSLNIKVYRKLIDGIPLSLETRLELSISGKPREIKIGQVVWDGSEVSQLISNLPTRIEKDGDIRLQVTAGKHYLSVFTRFTGDINNITDNVSINPTADDWPTFEYISFLSNTNIRQVKLTGATSIDTTQVDIPSDWANLPTYKLGADTTLKLETQYRGDDSPPANQLKVQRNLWLDFDGSKITGLENINGKMNKDWRINSAKDTTIGRATVENQPVLITDHKGQQGLEIRSPNINLSAVTLIDNPKEFSASGWDATADNFSATLHLPPGWRVLYAAGVDRIYGTWISKWDLWDLFLILIITAVTRKLMGNKAALLALSAMIIAYHEIGSPFTAIPPLLVLLALLPVTRGKFKTFLRSCTVFFAAVFVIGIISFAISAFRLAIYPSLEKAEVSHFNQPSRYDYASAPAPQADSVMEVEDFLLEQEEALSSRSLSGNMKAKRPSVKEQKLQKQRSMYQVTETDRVQTGPGLPTWVWNRISFNANSPVHESQALSITYCPPILTSLWRVLSVFFLAAYGILIILKLIPILKSKDPDKNNESGKNDTDNTSLGNTTLASLLGTIFISGVAILTPTNNAMASDYPPEYLLKELETRLTKAPGCLPNCISLNNGLLTVKGNNLTLDFEAYAQADVVMSLPQIEGNWQLSKVQLDQNTSPTAMRQKNKNSLLLTKGHHKVIITGQLLGDQTSISLPKPIHNFKVASTGWLVDGLVDGRVLNNSLTLRSTVSIEESKKDTLTPDPIAPLVTVQRTFVLDKEWHVETRVVRYAPKNGPIAVSIPLIGNEKVLNNEITIKEGAAQVQLKYNQRVISWNSVLEPTSTLLLDAKPSNHYVETWRIKPSSLWRIEYNGLAPVKEDHALSSLEPHWRPWPGEKLTVNISRPTGVSGPTHTVEKAELKYSPGERIQKSTLSLSIRSSLGEDYSFSVPKDAEILSVKNGNKKLNIPNSNEITVPLQPGLQNVTVDFQEKKEMGWNTTTPAIHLPSTATNISLSYSLARDRWPLYFSGPAIGPAMLYWGILVVIVLSAFALTIIIKKCRLNVPINIVGWLLLGIGLSTVNSYGVFAVIIFFILLGYRKDYIEPDKLSSLNFKLLQAGIVLITVVAAVSALSAIPMGLLSTPDMKVVGNGSSSHFYRFYQDSSASGDFPIANVISLPILGYRLVMMLWSLWLATRIMVWASWGWNAFSSGRIWKKK
jgi:hypothetical protein